MNHLEFLTEPVLRELRSIYTAKIGEFSRMPFPLRLNNEREFNQYRTLLREVEIELYSRVRDEIERKHG